MSLQPSHTFNAKLLKKGIILSNSEKHTEEEEDNAYLIKTAYKDYYNTTKGDDDNSSRVSDASTKPSDGSLNKKRHQDAFITSTKKKSKVARPLAEDKKRKYISDKPNLCKLCQTGWALNKKEKLIPTEIKWLEKIDIAPRNASLNVFIHACLEDYENDIRPISKEIGNDYGEMTLHEMEDHFRHCVKSVALERLFQIEDARETYHGYAAIEADQMDQGIVDHRASDQALKYRAHGYKLLKEKDKCEKDEVISSATR